MNEKLKSALIKRIRRLSSPMEPKPTGLAERLVPLPQLRAILFDVYGTLFISGTGDISIARATSNEQALTKSLQFSGFSGDLHNAGRRGTTYLLHSIQHTHEIRRQAGCQTPEVDIRQEWRNALTQLQQENMLQGNITTEAIMKVSVDYECRVNPIWTMPNVAETLRWLNEQPCILGIISNAQFYTKLLFPAFLHASYTESGFQPKVCAWSYEYLEAKPSVRLFHSVVTSLHDQYGIVPEETLYVGNDMLNDLYPASQLGLKTALFAGDQRSLRLREDDERCQHLAPDVIVTDLAHLSSVYTP